MGLMGHSILKMQLCPFRGTFNNTQLAAVTGSFVVLKQPCQKESVSQALPFL